MANIITAWNEFIITDAGLRLRQQTIATGAELTFCFAKIGQGVPSNPENIPLLTDIISEAERVPVVRSEADGVTHYVGVRVDNADFAEPVLMTEIGLFARIGDAEPVLYGYTYATQGYDSIPAGKVSHYIWTIGIDTVISRAQSISFTYDGSKVYATEEEMDVLIQAFDKFKADISGDLHKADEALEIANEVKKEMESFSPSGISSQDIIIPTSGWGDSKDADISGLSVDVSVDGASETMIPIVTIEPASDTIAQNCGFNVRAKTGNGYIRFYAVTAPAQPINVTATLLSPSGNTASGEYVLLPATADRLGGVKIGDNLTITDDGTLSVKTDSLVSDVSATDEEAQEIIDKYFGINSNPAVKI